LTLKCASLRDYFVKPEVEIWWLREYEVTIFPLQVGFVLWQLLTILEWFPVFVCYLR